MTATPKTLQSLPEDAQLFDRFSRCDLGRCDTLSIYQWGKRYILRVTVSLPATDDRGTRTSNSFRIMPLRKCDEFLSAFREL